MAARKNKKTHSENTKGEIRATQLLNRLFSNAMGEVEMTPAQVQSAKIFIGKFRADLKAIDITANVSGNINLTLLPVDADL